MELEIKDFSGGLTDQPMTGRPDQYSRADNLRHHPSGGMMVRDGSFVYSDRLPTGNQRVGDLINFMNDSYVLARSGSKLYYWNSGWTAISGPTNDALPSGLTTHHLSFDQWKGHLLAVSSGGQRPFKVFKNSSGTWKCVTAGLPAIAENANYVTATVLATAISNATSLVTAMKSHMNDAAYHSAADTTNYNTLNGLSAPTTLGELITYVNSVVGAYNSHYNDSLSIFTTQYHDTGIGVLPIPAKSLIGSTAAPSGAAFLYYTAPENLSASATLAEVCERLDDLQFKYNLHDFAFYIHDVFRGLYQASNSLIGYVDSGVRVEPNLDEAYSLANSLKTKFNSHVADWHAATVTYQHPADSSADAIAAASATSLYTLYQLLTELYAHFSNHYNDAADATPAYHVATHDTGGLTSVSYAPLNSGSSINDLSSIVAALEEIRDKFNLHEASETAHRSNTGQKYQEVTPEIEVVSWNYALHYNYAYSVGTVTYEDAGPVTFVGPVSTILSKTNDTLINKIPVLSNGSTNNYDTTVITIKVFRTKDDGTTYYEHGSLTNGTTSYSDTTDDSDLGTETVYTSGGVVDNDPPPIAKFVHILNNKAYYLNITEDGETKAGRLRESISDDIDSCPGDFYLDFAEDGMGISSARDRIVVFGKSKVYRVEGGFDELGRGGLSFEVIADFTGLVASYSPVQIEDGIVFWGTDGVYFTDAYVVKKISKDWTDTYLSIIHLAPDLIRGTYDKNKKLVWWGVTESGSENNVAYVLDLNKPLTENSCFTTASNGTDFAPTALCFINKTPYWGEVLRGDSRGYVFSHNSYYHSDPKVNTSASPSTWIKKAIIYDFISSAYDFGSLMVRKWVTSIVAKFRAYSATSYQNSIQIKSINDDGALTGSLYPIRYRGSNTLIEEKRRFQAGHLRCATKQIEFTNAKVIVTNSDTLGQATLNKTAKTLTLLSGSWPADIEDHLISFANDSYVTEWTIASISGGVMTITDAGGTLPANGTYKWVIRGYPKDEQFHMMGFSLNYVPYSATKSDAAGESGENA